MTHIVLVRHGTTEWMEQGLVHGRLDSRLSERGRQEAQQVALRLRDEPLQAFYTSPMGRTVETSMLIAHEIGQQPVVIDDLREMNFGWLEGRYMLHPGGAGNALISWLHQAVRGAIILLSGESWSKVKRRACEAVRQVVQQSPDARVLVVTHSGIHSAILSRLLDEPHYQVRLYPFSPCAITEIEVDEDCNGRLIALNQTQHLRK